MPARFFPTGPGTSGVPLDRDILDMIQKVIESDLAAPKVPKDRVSKLKKTWKCESAHDFLYGHRAGYYKGLAEGMMIERYKRSLLPDEDNEVFELTGRYAARLRRYFAYYKKRHTKK
jgi:hypothetical protein